MFRLCQYDKSCERLGSQPRINVKLKRRTKNQLRDWSGRSVTAVFHVAALFTAILYVPDGVGPFRLSNTCEPKCISLTFHQTNLLEATCH